jgi:hypothetical protein
MEKFKDAEAYWISPKGEVIPLFGRETHIKQIVKKPSAFRLTEEEVDKIFDQFQEEKGTEGKAREKIMISLINRGWIRIRNYERVRMFSINTVKMTKRVKDIIRQFAVDMLSIGYEKRVLKIDDATTIKEYWIEEIAADVLFGDLVGNSLMFFEDFDDYCDYLFGDSERVEFKDFRISGN